MGGHDAPPAGWAEAIDDLFETRDRHGTDDHPEVEEKLGALLPRRTREWDDLCPNGALRFYEGDDPERFRAEIIERFGFDPAASIARMGERSSWTEEGGWSFWIPAGLVEAVYGNASYPLGS